MSEITTGVGDSGIQPGVIGEIGTSQPVHPDEWKVLEAACRAQIETGLPLFVHPYPITPFATTAVEVAEFIVAQGVNPAAVNMCHLDTYDDVEVAATIARMGMFVSLDGFGTEVYFDSANSYKLPDWRREQLVYELVERGFADQILISHDVCLKLHLQKYGGYGYAHILRHIVPSLQRYDASGQLVRRIMIENPRRILTIGADSVS